MKRYQQMIFILLLFLTACSTGNNIIKDVPEEQNGVIAKPGEENRSAEAFQFLLHNGDDISVNVWRHSDLARSIQIDPAGYIDLPLAGELKASGLTIAQLRKEVTSRLSKYIVDPHVDITVSNSKNLKIHILGEIISPGTFDWRMGMSIWEVIAKAGGFNQDANMENILLISTTNRNTSVKVINLENAFKEGQLTQNINMRSGDLIYVLPKTIASIQRFMGRLAAIISPIVSLESGIVLYPQVKDVLKGNSVSGTVVVSND